MRKKERRKYSEEYKKEALELSKKLGISGASRKLEDIKLLKNIKKSKNLNGGINGGIKVRNNDRVEISYFWYDCLLWESEGK